MSADDNNNAAGAAQESTSLGMEAFYTRSKANDGVQLPLYTPDNRKTEHWVRILGVDSDAFRAADAESRRDAFRIAQIEDMAERAFAIMESKRRLVASLVTDWSFKDRPCTTDGVMAFFREAPQIMDAIDMAASKRALFFVSGSSSSGTSQNTSSVSI